MYSSISPEDIIPAATISIGESRRIFFSIFY